MGKTKKELEEALQAERSRADEAERAYNELHRQALEDITATAAYKEKMQQAEAERRLAEAGRDRYITTRAKLERLQEENARLTAGYKPGTMTADQADRLQAENARLKGMVAELRAQVQDLLSLLAHDAQAAPHTAGKNKVLEIPNAPKRGRRRKIDTETRAYIHELAKATDGSGRRVNSLQSIATITGVSKTQVYTILQEPAPAGRWYSPDGSGRQYFASYREAIRSKQAIHFEEGA